MSIHQSPIKTLEQIEWFLKNNDKEKFPNAFLTSAGNLSRQLLEQVQFILAFYSGMPQNKYINSKGHLKTANTVWTALKQINPATNRTYFEEARRRSPRLRKFARFPRSLNKWRNEFNEPSHFRNPAKNRKTQEKHIRDFVTRMRTVLDPLDNFLITAAANEMRSGGKIKAQLGNDEANTPSIAVTIIVKPSCFYLENGTLAFRTPQFPIEILPADKEIPQSTSKKAFFLQHSVGLSLSGQMVTEDGSPVNLTNLHTMLASMMETETGRKKMVRRLKKLGIIVEWEDKAT